MGSFNTVNGKYYCNQQQALTMKKANTCFNTAGGRCCCNNVKVLDTFMEGDCVVSIPQAVGVVATAPAVIGMIIDSAKVSIPQAVGVVATYHHYRHY